MKTVKPYYRPVTPGIVQAMWDMGLDTYEIALRTGFKESEVHKAVSAYRTHKYVDRLLNDKNHSRAPAQC